MGLGNVSIGSTYPEVSREEMLSKLNKLKQPFLKNFNPDLNAVSYTHLTLPTRS